MDKKSVTNLVEVTDNYSKNVLIVVGLVLVMALMAIFIVPNQAGYAPQAAQKRGCIIKPEDGIGSHWHDPELCEKPFLVHASFDMNTVPTPYLLNFNKDQGKPCKAKECEKAKDQCWDELKGVWGENFEKLTDYCVALCENNEFVIKGSEEVAAADLPPPPEGWVPPPEDCNIFKSWNLLPQQPPECLNIWRVIGTRKADTGEEVDVYAWTDLHICKISGECTCTRIKKGGATKEGPPR